MVDARTSDAVALAVRSNAPIYINSDILDIVGTVIEPEADMDDKSEMPASVSLDNLTNDILTRLPEAKLQELLDQAIKEERYEMAAMIRDEMEYRKHH